MKLMSSSPTASLPFTPLAISAAKQNLWRLVIIRWLLLTGLVFGVVIARQVFDVELPIKVLTFIVIVIVCINLFTHFRLTRNWPLSQFEFGAQLLADIAIISAVFYFCGGATNPFISYYLVPLIISAATLPWLYTAGFALLSLAIYSALLFYYQPIAALEPDLGEHAGHLTNVHPHIVGMWFNFLLSAALITFFVVRMSTALREQERELNARDQDNLRDEQVLAVATLAAGTAHELGSPLTTMKVLLSELEHSNADNTELQSDLQTLKQQIDVCSSTLKQLSAQAEVTDWQHKRLQAIGAYFRSVLERWALIRPHARATIHYEGDESLQGSFHPTLDQAIINVLNNAADANPTDIRVSVRWNTATVSLSIEDRGRGIPAEIREQLGQAFVTTKGKGLGLGLFLSNATIRRSGGTIKLFDRDGGGTVTVIELPVNAE